MGGGAISMRPCTLVWAVRALIGIFSQDVGLPCTIWAVPVNLTARLPGPFAHHPSVAIFCASVPRPKHDVCAASDRAPAPAAAPTPAGPKSMFDDDRSRPQLNIAQSWPESGAKLRPLIRFSVNTPGRVSRAAGLRIGLAPTFAVV